MLHTLHRAERIILLLEEIKTFGFLFSIFLKKLYFTVYNNSPGIRFLPVIYKNPSVSCYLINLIFFLLHIVQ